MSKEGEELADLLAAAARRTTSVPEAVGALPAPGQPIPQGDPAQGVSNSLFAGAGQQQGGAPGAYPLPGTTPATPQVTKTGTNSFTIVCGIGPADGIAGATVRRLELQTGIPYAFANGALAYTDDAGKPSALMMNTVKYLAVGNLSSGGALGETADSPPLLVLDLVTGIERRGDQVHCAALRILGNRVHYDRLIAQPNPDVGQSFGQLLVVMNQHAPNAPFLPGSGYVPTVENADKFWLGYLAEALAGS